MKRNVLVTLMIIILVSLTACNAVGGSDGTDPENPEDQPTSEEVAQVSTPAETAIPRLQVVMAVQNIPRGTVITPDRVTVVLYPVDVIPGDTFDEIEFVVGQIAATDIFTNELILSRKLVQSLDSLGSVGSDAAAILEPGRVAVAVPIDRITSVAYALQPGDRVDVIVSMLFVDLDQDFQTMLPNVMTVGDFYLAYETQGEENVLVQTYSRPEFATNFAFRADGFDSRTSIAADTLAVTGLQSVTVRHDMTNPVIIEPSEQQRPRLVTQRTVTDAQVLYVGEFPRDGRIFEPTSTPVATPEPDPNAVEAEEGEDVEPTAVVPGRPTIITLAVRPQDAVTLTYMAESSIPMTFALRSARTQGLPDTSPVTLNYILQTYNIQVPESLNFGIEPAIRSIRGITLENIFASGSPDDEGNVDADADAGGG